jgi:hypothetical protein
MKLLALAVALLVAASLPDPAVAVIAVMAAVVTVQLVRVLLALRHKNAPQPQALPVVRRQVPVRRGR